MQNFKEGHFTVENSVQVLTSTGMNQTRQLRLNSKGQKYISVEGYTDQSAVDSLFFFENNEIADEEWIKATTIQDLKRNLLNFKEYFRLHHFHYDNQGNLLKTYD